MSFSQISLPVHLRALEPTLPSLAGTSIQGCSEAIQRGMLQMVAPALSACLSVNLQMCWLAQREALAPIQESHSTGLSSFWERHSPQWKGPVGNNWRRGHLPRDLAPVGQKEHRFGAVGAGSAFPKGFCLEEEITSFYGSCSRTGAYKQYFLRCREEQGKKRASRVADAASWAGIEFPDQPMAWYCHHLRVWQAT